MDGGVQSHLPEHLAVVLERSLRYRVELRILQHDLAAARSFEQTERQRRQRSEELNSNVTISAVACRTRHHSARQSYHKPTHQQSSTYNIIK